MPPTPKKPYIITVYLHKRKRIIELRPRHGIWSPFIYTLTVAEIEAISPQLYYGPKSNINTIEPVIDFHIRLSAEGKLHTAYTAHTASKDFSYYIVCNRLPASIIFGQLGEEYLKEFIR